MATAPLSIPARPTLSGRELSLTTCEVRVWGMDTQDKPFIQNVTAGQITEHGALLTGLLPVKNNDVIGVRYLERKGRFKVTFVSDPDPGQTRSIGVECLEELNFFGVRKPIPIEAVSSLYAESRMRAGEAPPNRRKAERYPCRVAADVTLDNAIAQAHGWVSDISTKGCYLQLIAPFPAGSGIAVSIYGDMRQQPLVLRGVVRTSHPMVGMGVEFKDVTVNDLAGIQSVLEQLRGAKPAKSEQASAAWIPAPQEQKGDATEELPMAIEITSPRAMAMSICAELQKLEAEIFSLRDRKLTAEVRQAALHMKNVANLCPAG